MMHNVAKRMLRMAGAAGAAGGAAGLVLLGLGIATPAVAGAAASGPTTYMATLEPVALNGQTNASGTLKLVLTGTSATITEHVQGLAPTFSGSPFPHVQHIHGLAAGVCPTTATKNRTGVISTLDALPTYGAPLTTLSVAPGGTGPTKATTIKIAPSGASFTYSRTITLNAKTMQAIEAHNAVIVVHGLTPSTAPKAATTLKSTMVPSLPLAATAPALCGPLTVSQMSAVPSGAPQTGGGSTAGVQDVIFFEVGAGTLIFGAGMFAVRRKLRSAS